MSKTFYRWNVLQRHYWAVNLEPGILKLEAGLRDSLVYSHFSCRIEFNLYKIAYS